MLKKCDFENRLCGVLAVCRARLERPPGLNRICGWDSQSAGGSECKATSAEQPNNCDHTCCRGRRRRRGKNFWVIFCAGVGFSRYELGKGGRGGAGATDETNGRSMTIMNKVGLKLLLSPITSILYKSQIVQWCDKKSWCCSQKVYLSPWPELVWLAVSFYRAGRMILVRHFGIFDNS